MNDETSKTGTGEGAGEHAPRTGRCRSGRNLRIGVAAVALVALGAVTATALQATAHGPRGWHERHSALGVDDVRERAVHRAEWLLDAVDATPGQREQVNAIIGELVGELHPYAAQHRESRRAFVAELARPTPDPEALEALRASEIEVLDEVSREAVAALARMAEVLTPEQRVELTDRIGKFAHR